MIAAQIEVLVVDESNKSYAMEESNTLTEYERNLRKLYSVDNVKRGLQNMEELNDALGRPLDNVS